MATAETNWSRESERRREQRIRTELEIHLTSESQSIRGITWDLSAGGAGVTAFGVLPKRNPLDVRITLPRGVVMARGEVRWVAAGASGALSRMGVAWIELSPLDRGLLVCFLKLATLSLPPPRYSAEVVIGTAATIPPLSVMTADPVVIHARGSDGHSSRTIKAQKSKPPIPPKKK